MFKREKNETYTRFSDHDALDLLKHLQRREMGWKKRGPVNEEENQRPPRKKDCRMAIDHDCSVARPDEPTTLSSSWVTVGYRWTGSVQSEI
ncbi:hypothetical protein EVAR_45833_1 [Eumeta japonica]|uniref:Uncharacterized protein n=1 Tax=Eumeta variegata TaxID=151549 RepID=A0A4C1WPH1_EUMVA|nr:hypothetical protein EVAR_45833_1 [Eumeta japonica]